ncbi:MAG: nitroreductase family protein, partial [Steroidobacteraceae bacterium]
MEPRPIPFASLSRLLEALGEMDIEGAPRFLYPSAGDLHCIHAYVWVRPGCVSELPGGAYYYHPGHHALHSLDGVRHPDRKMFAERDRALFDGAAFAIVLVADLETITRTYNRISASLAAVEAGYMGQLLLHTQGASRLGCAPVACPSGARQWLELGPADEALHCVIGGLPRDSFGVSEDITRGAAEPPQVLENSASLELWERGPSSDERESGSFMELLAKSLGESGGDSAAKPVLRWRDARAGATVFPLLRNGGDGEAYRRRRCQRSFDREPLELRHLSGLLALLRASLASITLPVDFEAYIHVAANAVRALSSGLYRYDPREHRLAKVAAELTAELTACFMPFNRKHARQAAFT